MSPYSDISKLRRLARLYGVQTAYYNMFQRRTEASEETLLAVLRNLGAPINSVHDVDAAYRDKKQRLWQRPLEPVTVAWEGDSPPIKIRLPPRRAPVLHGSLTLSSGEVQEFKWNNAELPVIEDADVEGARYLVKQLTIPQKLAPGYHQFKLDIAGKTSGALIISAPRRAYTATPAKRTWGAFIPAYALHRQKSWGTGDFGDLEALAMWLAERGGGAVATLPFLASFLDKPFAPSPYSPASRLLWNELYLDIENIPELSSCPAAQAMIESPEFQEELNDLRHARLIHYKRQMALKRHVLEELCNCFFSGASQRLSELEKFARENPVVEDYSRFRAAMEFKRRTWLSWSKRMQNGILREGDYDEKMKRYHLYVQWLADQQIKSLSEKARAKGLQLYLDLPLGVHPAGYDVWREQVSFALDASAGAPPDVLFTNGQNWTFPPLHPQGIRENGYRYVRAYLQHHMKYAGILRIDHVMGLHRLYWIPSGLETSQGVYVNYNAEEFYAILSLESHRHACMVVGEDLGTVPPEVRPAMRQHGLYRMYVLGYELYSDSKKTLRPVPADSVAYLETHDMPPFAAFWQGLDIEPRRKIKLLNDAEARKEQENREAVKRSLVTYLRNMGWLKEPTEDIFSILSACLAFLGNSRSQIVLVNLEDLWLETARHNIPGTEREQPNWRRKARYDFEKFCKMPRVTATLQLMRKLGTQE